LLVKYYEGELLNNDNITSSEKDELLTKKQKETEAEEGNL
jgi:hypothetical protein